MISNQACRNSLKGTPVMLLLNAFSLNMLASLPATPTFSELTLEEVNDLLASANWSSGVGHADTAAVFADTLGTSVLCARITVTLEKGDVAIIGQYRGPHGKGSQSVTQFAHPRAWHTRGSYQVLNYIS